jgi:alpha-D-ribose 1-methylphosphonate 5-triphosphate diphosphatase PhnM
VVRLTAEEEHPVQGEKRITTRRYGVTILISSPEILTGDSVLITVSNDPMMTGGSLRVESSIVGSEVWSRELVAVEFEGGS